MILQKSLEEINKINNYLKEQLWMEFELCKLNGGEIILSGSIDEAGEENIRIKFLQPYFISCILSLTYEGKNDFIQLVTDDEFIEINKRYHVEKGNFVFKIKIDDIEEQMLIIAKEIESEIMEN
jgi:hypothetical protein